MGDWKILDTAGTAIDIETSYNIKVQQAYGVGMPPIRNVITPYGLVDGGKFQRSIAPPREFTLECILPKVAAPTQALHHSGKKSLVELIKRDRQLTEGAVTVRYTGATADVQIDAYYVSGLEGGEITGNVEKFSMQMVAPDPFWKGTSLNNTALNPGTALTANHALRRTSAGSWANFGSGGGTTTDYINAIAEDADNIYLGGVFTTWDSGTVNNIVRYDKAGGTYHAMGGGGTVGVAGTINSLAIDSGGTLYIGGDFPSAGTVTTPALTRYHETPDAFEDLGMSVFAGTLDIVLGCVTDTGSDDCYFVGEFNFMHYDGGTINNLESFGAAGSLMSIAIDTADKVVVGGEWGTSNLPAGLTSQNVGQYDITAGTWNNLGDGSTKYVNAIAVNPDNTTVYTASNSSGTAIGTFQKWSGAEWSSLGVINTDGGTQVTVNSIAYDTTNDRLLAMGDFASIDANTSLNLISAYSFTSSAWADIAVDLQSQISHGKAVNYYHSDTSTVFGYENTGGAASITIPQTTAVTNSSTATAYPTITLLGPGSVTKIEHLTTGAKLEFSGLTLLTSETMTINLSPGAKTISTNFRSDLLSKLSSGSNLGTFALMPQAGTISLQSAATVAGTISWYDTHWSIYGAQ